MIFRMRHVLALVSLLAAGCVVHERLPDPPPDDPPPAPARPPAPAARSSLLAKNEAVRIAADFVRKRGLEVQRFRARLDGQGRWRVDLKGEGGDDRATVLVNARTGKVERARIKEGEPEWEEF
jgi:hypothetical protein